MIHQIQIGRDIYVNLEKIEMLYRQEDTIVICLKSGIEKNFIFKDDLEAFEIFKQLVKAWRSNDNT